MRMGKRGEVKPVGSAFSPSLFLSFSLRAISVLPSALAPFAAIVFTTTATPAQVQLSLTNKYQLRCAMQEVYAIDADTV